MTSKEYLSQAYRLDKFINSRIEQCERLRELATRATGMTEAVRVSGTARHSRVEDYVCKIVDMENDIKKSVYKLIDLKKSIQKAVGKLQNKDHKLLIELRYLNSKSWEQIAVIMNYSPTSMAHIHRLHGKALDELDQIIKKPNIDSDSGLADKF